MSRALGAALGMLGFAVTLIAGLWVHNPVERTLVRALLSAVIFVVIGLLLGGAIELVFAEYLAARRRASTPDPPAGARASRDKDSPPPPAPESGETA